MEGCCSVASLRTRTYPHLWLEEQSSGLAVHRRCVIQLLLAIFSLLSLSLPLCCWSLAFLRDVARLLLCVSFLLLPRGVSLHLRFFFRTGFLPQFRLLPRLLALFGSLRRLQPIVRDGVLGRVDVLQGFLNRAMLGKLASIRLIRGLKNATLDFILRIMDLSTISLPRDD